MRTLKFVVDGLKIEKDPNCDFDNLVPGTEGYLQAVFSFSSEWQGCNKVAAFFSMTGKEYEPQILEDGKSCIIPAEALKKRRFKIQVLGKKEGFGLVTSKVTVSQNGGKV